MLSNTDSARLARARRLAARHDLMINKSRVREPHYNDQGGYMIAIASRNAVAWGERFDLSLAEVEAILADYTKSPAS